MKSAYLEMSVVTSPHVKRGTDVRDIMRNVVWALLPLVGCAYYTFGLSALTLIVVTTLSCLVTEHLLCLWSNSKSTVIDYSAIITGILLGLTLPPGFPLWMGVVGGIVSIVLGKTLFGGLGYNVFNPALVGRAFLQGAFPVSITTWSEPFILGRFSNFISTSLTMPFMKPFPDAVTGATPLSAMKWDKEFAPIGDLFMGGISGSVGETSAIIILVCGSYLLLRKMADWRVPASILLTVFLLSGIFHLVDSSVYPSPLFMLFSGGLMLGAFFMASDMVTSPVTNLGIWIYGAVIGLLVVVIRLFGGLPEGVMYAILLGNALVPLLNQWTQPRTYGRGGKA